ncbi:MAG TPA: flavin reductase family protein [Frankiaceae bacterium]|nr:flavin reductase family protein [Frankiaceae bacterium]
MTEAVKAFEGFVGGLDYPMYVVTAFDGTTRAGCLVGFTTQCSIDPPRFLVCVSVNNHTHAVAAGAEAVAVHLLRAEQHDVAELFGSGCGAEVDKFARVSWAPGPEGVPVLADCAGWFAGRVLARLRLGDHTGLLVEPVAGRAPSEGAETLRFAHVHDLEPGHPA